MGQSETKFCVDCRHCQRSIGGGQPRCFHPSLADVDLVTGPYIADLSCSTHRSTGCGEGGKLFERRKSVAERLVDWIMS